MSFVHPDRELGLRLVDGRNRFAVLPLPGRPTEQKGTTMRKRLALAIVALAATALALFGPGLAGAETTTTPKTDKIEIKIVKGNLKFVGPKTVSRGDFLEIVNTTNPKQVGPHTFSLVTKGSLPKSHSAQENCFTPNHICMAIAKWQGSNGKSPPTKNPAKAGPEGWSTMGNLNKKGDSWFTGEKPGTSFSQVVSASSGTTLYFMCAIHPFMQGSIKVEPAN
jgi:hypothetical protein